MQDSSTPTNEQPDLGRRRFTRGGAAAPIVLGSLVSQPVLGQQLYYCTVSGNMSGNVSPRPGAVTNCRLGEGPSTWFQATVWPSAITRGTVGNSNQCSSGGTLFNGFGSGLVAGGLSAVFFCKQNAFQASDGQGSSAATMLQVLRFSPDTQLIRLGRATVASLLNAYNLGTGYPVNPTRIIEMFNAVCNGGTYALDAGRPPWDQATVIWYFESLFKSA